MQPGINRKYYIKNSGNLKYFSQLVKEFNFRDISFIRRIQFFKALRKTCSQTDKDLKDITRDDVKAIIASLNKVHKTAITRKDFINYNKTIWKIILPEKDLNGRPDDSIIPYSWRIEINNDKSLQRDKADKFTPEEYARIQNSLSKDPRTQLFLALMYECLARPQELCYVNIEDVDLRDNYARIRIKEHGKEGTKTLQIIDSYFYLAEWLNHHPRRDDKESPLFITMANNSRYERLSPKQSNKVLQRKLKELGIRKHITNYSFKRNGVTARYIAGEAAQNIQKIAGWTSTDQLHTYDLSSQEDFLKEELKRKGILKTEKVQQNLSHKRCFFCNAVNPTGNSVCGNCKRPLDRENIMKEETKKNDEMKALKEQIEHINKVIQALANERKIDQS